MCEGENFAFFSPIYQVTSTIPSIFSKLNKYMFLNKRIARNAYEKYVEILFLDG